MTENNTDQRHHRPSKSKVAWRLTYTIILLVLTVVAALANNHEQLENLAGKFENALNDIDPFRITRDFFEHKPLTPIVLASSPPKCIELAESSENNFEDFVSFLCIMTDRFSIYFFKDGWLGISILCVSTAIIFYLCIQLLSAPNNRWGRIRPQHPGASAVLIVWWSVILSGFVAVPLKWALILLTIMFGRAIGFLGWIDGVIIGGIEVLLNAHHIYKGSIEVKETAKEVHDVFKT